MRVLALALLLLSTYARASQPSDATLAAAEALLRYLATSPPLVDEKPEVCITLAGQPASSAFIERLANTGLKIAPCGGKNIVTKVPIGELKQEPDGTYELSYGYLVDCINCATQGKIMFAFVRQDSKGWHVLRVQGSVSM